MRLCPADPIAAHKARKHRQRAELIHRGNNTFAAAARAYVEEHAKPKQRRWPETARLLGMQPNSLEPIAGGLAGRWYEKPVGEIDGHDIWCAVDEARRQGVPGLKARTKGSSEARARALHAALSALFTWLQRQQRVTSNPCAGLHRPEAPRPRERTLSNDEMRLFWQACDAVGEPFGAIFKLLLLTGARLNEIAGMRRSELHANGLWHLPGSRTKNRRPYKLLLPPMALALIPPGQHDLVFTTTGTTPPSGWSRAKRRLDAVMFTAARERARGASIAPWRLHDLRRTAVTGMAELGVRPDIIELCVNHVSGSRGGIAGVYNHSELLPNARRRLSAGAHTSPDSLAARRTTSSRYISARQVQHERRGRAHAH